MAALEKEARYHIKETEKKKQTPEQTPEQTPDSTSVGVDPLLTNTHAKLGNDHETGRT